MEEIIIHPKDEGQQEALLTILNGLGIPYEQKETEETERIIANQDLLEKIQQGRKDREEGKGVTISVKDLWK